MNTYIEMRNESIGEDLVLEALKQTKANLAASMDPDDESAPAWEFDNWNACACGHIYIAATDIDQEDVLTDRVTAPATVDGLYEEVMKAVARANPRVSHHYALAHVSASAIIDDGGWPLANAVSDACASLGGNQQAAIVLVDNAITAIEGTHEQARQRLMAGGNDV